MRSGGRGDQQVLPEDFGGRLGGLVDNDDGRHRGNSSGGGEDLADLLLVGVIPAPEAGTW